MSNATRYTCPNCDEQRSVVAAADASTAEFSCPNCDEPIVVAFGSD